VNYVKMIENMDEVVGAVMKMLMERGMEENTLIVFVSDHGVMELGSSKTPKD
jgi:Arylsulfatase A and related enzymes